MFVLSPWRPFDPENGVFVDAFDRDVHSVITYLGKKRFYWLDTRRILFAVPIMLTQKPHLGEEHPIMPQDVPIQVIEVRGFRSKREGAPRLLTACKKSK